jgi:Flp pilus assembly protein TadG
VTRRSRSRAQSVLEFALVVPLFMLLLFALIDFARLAFTYVSLSNGAREMARTAAISQTWNNGATAASNASITAFNNYTIVAAPQNGATDKVTILTGSQSCAHSLDTGGTCTPAPTSTVCTLPLQTASCTVPQPKPGGYVEVQVTYTFQFSPLFQTRLDGIIDVSFMRPTAVVTTASRSYVE